MTTDKAAAPVGAVPQVIAWEMKYPHAMPMIDLIAASEFVRSEERAKQLVDICQRRYGEPATYRPLYATPQATTAAVDDAMVERVGSALYVYWSDVNEAARNAYRKKIRAALAAPAEVKP